MKDYLNQLINTVTEHQRKRSLVQEYLQARLLQALQDLGLFSTWAFVGGTALRFLYQLPRYSEDLDFSIEGKFVTGSFERALRGIKTTLEAETYKTEIKLKTAVVCSAFVRFPGLLFELGISPHQTESLSVKVELDTNPPSGARTTTTLVRRYVTLNLFHHDQASLLAGKLHAVLSRPYTKGRDLYDLIWYLSDQSWPDPNLTLLNNALRQTKWPGVELTPDNWRRELKNSLDRLDWEKAKRDVSPFLERPQDAALVNYQTLQELLAPKRAPFRLTNPV